MDTTQIPFVRRVYRVRKFMRNIKLSSSVFMGAPKMGAHKTQSHMRSSTPTLLLYTRRVWGE